MRLERSISWDFTADGRRFSCVDVELESSNWGLHPYFGEGIPVFLDDLFELFSVFFWAIGPVDVPLKFILMDLGIKLDDIISWRKVELRSQDCSPVILEQDVVIPQFVFKIVWLFIYIGDLRSIRRFLVDNGS